MKKIILSIAAAALISCSKTKEDIVEKPESISGTFWHHYFDADNNYVKTELSFHECRIENPAIIAQWKAYPSVVPYCDSNDTLELVLSKPCPKPCPIDKRH